MHLKLVIGNKNYSSWSLRPWVLLKAFDVHFIEENVTLADEGLRDRLLAFSPSARVPVMIERDLTIWDSLAICEYINDIHLDGKGWPHVPKERAKARAITCEMHAGFSALRSQLPMNIRAKRSVEMTPALEQDIARVDEIWRNHHRNGWLFETFSIADCFYAPVAFRFETYGIELSEEARNYQQKLLDHAALQAWRDGALSETETLACEEVGVPV
jgi:glutathione S-transferase